MRVCFGRRRQPFKVSVWEAAGNELYGPMIKEGDAALSRMTHPQSLGNGSVRSKSSAWSGHRCPCLANK